MKYYKLDPTSDLDSQYVDICLTMGETKILHNLCVDLLNEHPEMISYRKVMQKLLMSIEDHEFSATNDLPF